MIIGVAMLVLYIVSKFTFLKCKCADPSFCVFT